MSGSTWSSSSPARATIARPLSSRSAGRFSSGSGVPCLGPRSAACTRCARLPRTSEMFDLRYHVASLAAVFLALVIGILVGVGISDPVNNAKTGLLEQRIGNLQKQLDQQVQQTGNVAREQDAARSFINETYPV